MRKGERTCSPRRYLVNHQRYELALRGPSEEEKEAEREKTRVWGGAEEWKKRQRRAVNKHQQQRLRKSEARLVTSDKYPTDASNPPTATTTFFPPYLVCPANSQVVLH